MSLEDRILEFVRATKLSMSIALGKNKCFRSEFFNSLERFPSLVKASNSFSNKCYWSSSNIFDINRGSYFSARDWCLVHPALMNGVMEFAEYLDIFSDEAIVERNVTGW